MDEIHKIFLLVNHYEIEILTDTGESFRLKTLGKSYNLIVDILDCKEFINGVWARTIFVFQDGKFDSEISLNLEEFKMILQKEY